MNNIVVSKNKTYVDILNDEELGKLFKEVDCSHNVIDKRRGLEVYQFDRHSVYLKYKVWKIRDEVK